MQDTSTTPDIDPQNPLPAEKPGWVKTAAILTMAIGLVVLCGWAFDIEALKRMLPGLVTMKANTATAFILSGICLYLQTRHISPALLLARRAAAALVLLLGLATLCEYQFGWDAGIDQLMFSEPPGEILTSHPGRMSTITAANFALIGGALLLIEARLWAVAQATALAAAAFALMPLAGYIFGNLMLTHIGHTTAIAAHTVTAFLILATGVLTATRNHGFMVWLRWKSRVIGLAASLAMLILIFGAAYYNFVQKDKASQWVERTYEAIHSMEAYSDSMHDFLYHSRGFLITGDDRHLTEKEKRRESMAAEFVRMHRLMSGNQAQYERLDALDKLARQRMELASLAVQLRRKKGLNAAAAMLLSGQNDTLNAKFEAKLDELRTAEKALLKERQKTAEIIRASSLFTLGILLTASILLLLWVFRASQREIAERRQMEEKLRVASLYARSLIEASLDPLVTINPEGKITDANLATEEATGIPRNELIGADFSGYFTEPEKAQAGYRQVFDQGFVRDYPLTIRHQSGRLIDVLYNATVYRDEAGSVQGVFAAARDITERRQMEKEIARSEALFRNYFDLGQIGMAITSIEQGWLRVNIRLCEMLGYTREELSGMTWTELTYPDDLEPDMVQFRKLLSGEIERYSMDKRFIRKGGSILHTYLAVSCQRKPDGGVDYVIASLQDITGRKQTEDELMQERLFLAALLDNIAEAVVSCDARGMLTRFNQAARELHGLPEQPIPPELWGDYYDLYQADGKTPLRKEAIPLFRALQGERVRDAEMAVVQKGGTAHFLIASGQPMRDSGGKLLGAVVTMHDITERKLAENELREKEERLALATLHNGVGVWDWNLVTQEMIWDDSMFSLYHIRREDFIGTEEAWRAALHPDDLHRGDREVNDAIAGIRPFDTEFRVVWPNGEIHHIKAVAKVFRDEKGTPLRMLGINMDITELRQTAIALQEKTSLLRNIIDSSADYIFAKDRELRTILCNEIFAKAVGKHVQDLIGKTDIENGWDPLLVKGDAAKGIRGYEQDDLDAVAGKTVHSVDQIYVDGELHYVDTMKLPLRDDAGHTLGMFGISRDITESKSRENIQMARLRLTDYAANHTLKELLVATLDEACALTGSSIGFYHFLDADQKTLSLQAWSTRTTREFCKAEGEGSHYNIDQAGVWVDCVRERRPVIHNAYAALPHKRGLPPGHAHVEREMVVPIFRNELIVAILGVGNKTSPYKDNDLDSVTQLADLAWDIAVARRADDEVHRLNAELEQRVMERTAQLEAANRDMEGFSYSVSHDLRSPLRAIDGFSRILLEDYAASLDDEGRRLLHVVSDNAQKMGELIDDILAFSRTTRQEVTRSEIDMAELVRGIMDELGPETAGRELELAIKVLPPARADRSMLHQVLLNLLGNAVKFTRHKAPALIEVGARSEGNEIIYYVKDNGVGFDMQYADKLFGVFHRLHGQDEFEGTGIGLAIVKRIITKHGGRVWAEGRLNEGATVYFTLPVKGD